MKLFLLFWIPWLVLHIFLSVTDPVSWFSLIYLFNILISIHEIICIVRDNDCSDYKEDRPYNDTDSFQRCKNDLYQQEDWK